MNRLVLLTLLACASCAATPRPPPVELPPLPEPAATRPHRIRALPTSPVPPKSSGDTPAAVLRDSSALAAETYRYVAWDQARPENIKQLIQLKAKVDEAVRALRRTRKPTVDQVAATRAAAEELARFFRNKQD